AQDYVRTARAKGLAERVVVLRHALKNSLIPFITVVGIELGYLLGGLVVVEQIFSWPGIGMLTVQSIDQRDYSVVQGAVLLTALGRDRLALLGIALFLLVFVAAVGAPLLAPFDPTAVHVVDRLKPPSAQYLLGTDELGRDTLSRIIYGARASFSVGVVAVAISL